MISLVVGKDTDNKMENSSSAKVVGEDTNNGKKVNGGHEIFKGFNGL